MLEIVLIGYCPKKRCLTYVRAWRNGRRRRLKISSLYGRVGSSPAVRTTLILNERLLIIDPITVTTAVCKGIDFF